MILFLWCFSMFDMFSCAKQYKCKNVKHECMINI